jgi:hypothetical protein
MWNLLLAGVIGGIAYLTLKDDKGEPKKEESISSTSKKKIVRSTKANASKEAKLDLLYEIQKDGFDYALMSYSDYKGMKDEKFNELRSNFIKNAKAFEKYIEMKNPMDSEENLYAEDILSEEGLSDGFLKKDAYHNWKDVKDSKFQKLYSDVKNSYNELLAHIKSKFKIKNLSDDELRRAIDKLEGQ